VRFALLTKLRRAFLDLVPLILVIAFFQLFILRQPFPELGKVLVGAVFVIVGLMLFVEGLEMGLFPIGDAMAMSLARKGSVPWLLVFGFGLGFTTTVAEPALIAICQKAAEVATEERLIPSGSSVADHYALGLRLTVALSVGFAVAVGIFRILRGWPVHWLVIGGYLVVTIMTPFAPDAIVGIAFDAGGVTTSTVTVPLATALGVGLASSVRGRNPLVDGFGLIALASLFPMIFVMGYGLVVFGDW